MSPTENFESEVSDIAEVRSGHIALMFSHSGGKTTLESIWSEKARGEGHASRAMRSVLELADKYHIDIYAQPYALRYDTELQEDSGMFPKELIDLWDQLNEQGMTNEQLLEWYLRLGFELTGTYDGDHPIIFRRSNAYTPSPRF